MQARLLSIFIALAFLFSGVLLQPSAVAQTIKTENVTLYGLKGTQTTTTSKDGRTVTYVTKLAGELPDGTYKTETITNTITKDAAGNKLRYERTEALALYCTKGGKAIWTQTIKRIDKYNELGGYAETYHEHTVEEDKGRTVDVDETSESDAEDNKQSGTQKTTVTEKGQPPKTEVKVVKGGGWVIKEGISLSTEPTASICKCAEQACPSTGQVVQPAPGDGTGTEQGVYLPPTGDPNGMLVGTIQGPDRTSGPTDFYYETIDQSDNHKYFKSKTDKLGRFLIIADAVDKLIRVARSFDHDGKLDEGSSTTIARDADVPNVREVPNALSHGSAITGGNSSFERSKEIVLKTRNIDPSTARVEVDGHTAGIHTLAASNSSVVAMGDGVSTGMHTIMIHSKNGTTNKMPADFVDVNLDVAGSHEVGSIQTVTLHVNGLPPNHPATVTFSAGGAITIVGGGQQITVPVTGSTATTQVQAVHAGESALRWQLHVTIPGFWP